MVGIVGDGTRQTARFDGVSGRLGVAASLRAGRQVIGLGDVAIDHLVKSALIGGSGGRQVVSVATAWHSREGNKLAAVKDSGGVVRLEPGDTLEVTYAADTSAVASTTTSPHFLAIDAGPAQTSPLRAEQKGPDLPLRFALHQNQPNPFASTTTFRFDLPRAERVTLEVMDIQGRRIARVADGSFAAGYHAVKWGRQSRDGKAAPGVYLYRIVAGSFRDRKKLVVLP